MDHQEAWDRVFNNVELARGWIAPAMYGAPGARHRVLGELRVALDRFLAFCEEENLNDNKEKEKL